MVVCGLPVLGLCALLCCFGCGLKGPPKPLLDRSTIVPGPGTDEDAAEKTPAKGEDEARADDETTGDDSGEDASADESTDSPDEADPGAETTPRE